MATQLVDLRALTRELVGDNDSADFTDADVNLAINRAIFYYCDKTGVTYLETAGISDAAGKLALPADGLRITRVIGATKPLDSTTMDVESFRNPNWRGTTGTALRWFPFDGRHVQTSPRQATTSFTLGYLQIPADLSLDTDVPDTRIPDSVHPFLRYAAGAWLLQRDGDTQDLGKSQSYMQVFNNLVGIA